MVYYKSLRLIDEKPKWIISDENYNIIKNPTNIQIKLAIDEKERPKKCCICEKEDSFPNFYRHYGCEKYNCTGYLCAICYQKYDPNSPHNKIKLEADSRTENLDPLSPRGKGFIGQQIVANTFGVEDCNLKTDNFNFYIDLSKISGYGYSEVKIASLIRDIWDFNTKREQEYDYIFLVCMDKNWSWKNVERIYAMPWETVGYRKSIGIYKNPSRGGWYKEFRIDEKPFNDTYHNMNLANCKVLRKNK